MNRLLAVVMDGVGERQETHGNAVALANTPNLDWLRAHALFTTLGAHGTYVGMPSDSDLGNSEVGHNAIGSGQVVDQGAKLVDEAIESGSIFQSESWNALVERVKSRGSTLHFIGLLSDGNVHSHEKHLHAMLEHAVREDNVARIRIHVLFDGRDVGERSAELYVERLETLMAQLNSNFSTDVRVGSAGGRMEITMDRYGADWEMVRKGWAAHVLGEGFVYPTLSVGLKALREKFPDCIDQHLPPFVVGDDNKPGGVIQDGDSVVFFNFRGDRAIEISQAFTEDAFTHFDRGRRPDVFYAGMMEYDGDLKIPTRYLVSPPVIRNTLGELLATKGLKQFACSETQKYGHVTYFWNGNRSGKFSESLEHYVEVPSDKGNFDRAPEMKAHAITQETLRALADPTIAFMRINFANGDMVGHTGNLEASIRAVETVDNMVGQLVAAAKDNDVKLVVTADHGNCDEMFLKGPSGWEPRTSHTTQPVPCYIYDAEQGAAWKLSHVDSPGIANLASTFLDLMGLPEESVFCPSLIKNEKPTRAS